MRITPVHRVPSLSPVNTLRPPIHAHIPHYAPDASTSYCDSAASYYTSVAVLLLIAVVSGLWLIWHGLPMVSVVMVDCVMAVTRFVLWGMGA